MNPNKHNWSLRYNHEKVCGQEGEEPYSQPCQGLKAPAAPAEHMPEVAS